MNDWAQRLLTTFVVRYPDPFKVALKTARPDLFLDSLGRWDAASFKDFAPHGRFRGFEDLATLFAVGKFNRAVIRLDLDEAALLYRTAQSLPDPVGVEIGRGWGGSTLLLALASGPKGKLYSIQLEPTHDKELIEVAERGGVRDRMELLVGDSRTIPFATKVDYAFIDGGHEYDLAKHDHLRYGALVRPGGCIIHHDMADARPGATTAPWMLKLRDEILEHQRDVVKVDAAAGSLLVLRRVGEAWPQF